MISINLTTGQKIQIGFILLVIGIAIYAFVHNSSTPIDSHVNAWSPPPRKYPVNLAQPLSPNNPYDPKKETTVYVFACYDGQMEITEYRNDPGRRPTIAWVKVDTRRKTYLYYQDPMAPVKLVKDPCRHAVALAAYSLVISNRRLGLLEFASLSSEQLTVESTARKAMNDTIEVLKLNVETGSFRSDLLEKVMTALNAYRRAPGDPMKDTAKAVLVHNVLQTATDYLKAFDAKRSEAIEKYIDAVMGELSDDQRVKVADAGKNIESRQFRFAIGNTPNPAPAPRPRPNTFQANPLTNSPANTTRPGGRTPRPTTPQPRPEASPSGG